MFTRLDKYLLKSSLGLFSSILGLALAILLMERLIRLASVLSGSDNIVINIARLVSNLVPHYLELALPGALLITTIISVNRFSRSGEITTLLASGLSLWRISRAYMVFGAVLAISSIILSGYLQPISRYNYRQAVNGLKQTTIVSAFQESKFVQFKDQTVWTSSVDHKGNQLGETFIAEMSEDGSIRFLTGRSGELVNKGDDGWSIKLNDAMLGTVPAARKNGKGTQFVTRNVDWQMPISDVTFRARGKDQRELTLGELINMSYTKGAFEIDPRLAAADVNDRLSRATLLLILPMIGVVLGLNLRRNPRSGGVVIGILLLLMVQKILEFGLNKAESGHIPVWAGFWPTLVLLGLLSAGLFWRASRGRPIWNGFRRRGEDKVTTPPATASGQL